MTQPQLPDPLLQAATEHHVAGRLEEALAGYRQVLAQRPEDATALHRLGVLLVQTGLPDAAQELFARVVARDPAAWRSHCARGQALAALGRAGEAAASFQSALEANPECFEAWMGLGGAGGGSGAIRRACALRPDSADALAALGDALQGEDRPGEAEAAYRQALALDPGHFDAQNNLGIALQAQGRAGEASAAFRRAAALRPGEPLPLANLGNALFQDQRPEEAVRLLQDAAARFPGSAALQYNLGIAAFQTRDFALAADAHARAVQLDPGHVRARTSLGNALQALGRYPEALKAYREALRVDPASVDTLNNASAAARTLGLMDEALAHLLRAIELKPGFKEGHCNLGNVLKDLARTEEAMACYRRALALDPGDAVTHSNLVYTACFHPDYDAKAILRETRGWDDAHGAPLRSLIRPHANVPDPGRALKVGYLSPNFREHVLAHFLVPLLAHHDPGAVRAFGYSLAPRPDATTLRIRGLMQEWRDVAGLDDERLAERIREDGIDILVDLTMHMAGGRPLVFARKPAPVQVAWLAYPGTTGMAAMDYRLTDANLDPEGEDGAYAETSIRLADVFSCYDPLAREPQPGPLPALANGYVTFGSFNNFGKTGPRVEALWRRVLEAVPGSRLLLLAQQGDHRQAFLNRMAQGGIDPARVEFTPFQPRAEYLRQHQRVDIALDTFPYSGHTTSLDALWMGVPVVTQKGGTVVGRTAWTLLANLGLAELAARDDEGYLRIAADLAGDLPRLAALRSTLRARMEVSPLMDAPRFARAMERAYRTMWEAWCARERGPRT